MARGQRPHPWLEAPGCPGTAPACSAQGPGNLGTPPLAQTNPSCCRPGRAWALGSGGKVTCDWKDSGQEEPSRGGEGTSPCPLDFLSRLWSLLDSSQSPGLVVTWL